MQALLQSGIRMLQEEAANRRKLGDWKRAKELEVMARKLIDASIPK